MRIRLSYLAPETEEGGHLNAAATVRVETDEEAAFAGQEFARLCRAIVKGAGDYQRAFLDSDS